MAPEPPRRGKLPSVREENVSRAPHTPVPNDADTAPPPAMPMPPPKHLAAPRPRIGSKPDLATLTGIGPPAERRPAPANPPPPESAPPRVEMAEPQGQVVIGNKRWSLSVPSAVVLALFTCAGGAFTAWVNKPAAEDPTPALKAVRDEMAALRAELTAQHAGDVRRLDGLETKVDRLQDSQDRLRERFNERFAK